MRSDPEEAINSLEILNMLFTKKYRKAQGVCVSYKLHLRLLK